MRAGSKAAVGTSHWTPFRQLAPQIGTKRELHIGKHTLSELPRTIRMTQGLATVHNHPAPHFGHSNTRSNSIGSPTGATTPTWILASSLHPFCPKESVCD